jgi:hypothetical protein
MTDQPTGRDTDGGDGAASPDPASVDDAGEEGEGDAGGSRDVEVPMDVYKAVTVFSTLIAVLFVVVGFVVLDEATQRATAAPDEVNIVLAVVGLGAIALGAGTYAFSTRFRAGEMGNPKDDADQDFGNG